MSYRKRNGKWSYRYRVLDPKTGKWKQKETRGFATKKEALSESVRIQAELEKGIYIEEKKITFDEFAEKWIDIYAASGAKESTVDLRRRSLKIASNYFGKLKMKDITKLMYQDTLNELKKKGYKRRSIAIFHEALPMLFSKAVELEVIKTDPTIGASVPEFKHTVEELEEDAEIPKYLEKEELKALLSTLETHSTFREYALIMTLAYTGIRIGELCALKWKDFNREEKYISITKTIYIAKGGIKNYKLTTPKTKTSKRKVTISESVIETLDKLKQVQNEYKMSKRNIYYDNDFMFANDRKSPGYPESPVFVDQQFKKYLALSKLPVTLSPHSLRHTHVSLLAETGKVALETIQRRLGHKNDRVTREIYLHVTKKLQSEAPELFEKLMDF